MSATGLLVFDNTMANKNAWLLDLERAIGGPDRRRAYRSLHGVLHALSDRMSPDEAADSC